MTILIDPEENESHAIFNLPIPWTNAFVLEIGSGDGRLTWRFAEKVKHVTAIEPDAEKHKIALADQPRGFEHVEFLNLGLDEFYEHVTLSGAKGLKQSYTETLQSPSGSFRVTQGEKFDLVLLSWSL